jgi:PAS domain S-box-containing protein
MDKAKILIVEDEIVVAHDIKSTLEGLGYEVTAIAATAENALASARENRPDLALMDIVIKGDKDGIGAAAAMREELDIPVVYLTAYSDEAILERAKTTEPYGYIIKPFQERELHSTIEMALFKSRAEQRIAHLNRVLRAIRNVNQLIVHEKDRQRLIERACESLTETRGYHNVWIALYDKTGALSITAGSGTAAGFESLKEMLRAGDEIECIKKAKLSPQPISIEDPCNMCVDCPLGRLYEERGGLATRLEHEEEIFGFLVVSTTRETIRDEEDLDLFRELALDIGLALHGIATAEVRRRSEKALQESEYVLDRAQKIAQLGCWNLNIDTMKIEGSEVLLKIFDIDGDELFLDDFANVVHPDDLEDNLEHIQNGIVHGVPWNIEHRLLLKDGTVKWVNAIGDPLADNEGKTTRIVGIVQDITERKRAEELLRESEDNFKQVVTNIAAAVWKADIREDGTFENQYTSSVLEELLGLPASGSTNSWDKHLSHIKPEYMERVSAAFKEAIESPGKIIDLDFEVTKENGQTAWFSSKGRCFERDGKLHIFGSTTDITLRKQAEEKLKDSEKRSRAWLEHSPICTKIVDLDFNLQFMSRAGIEGLGISDVTSLYGKPYPFDFYPDSFRSRMTNNLEKARATGAIITLEAPVEDMDGGKLWFHSTLVPVKDDEGGIEYILIISADTTERNQAEEALRASSLATETSTNAIFVADMNGLVSYANTAAVKLWGYKSAEEMIGTNVMEYWTESTQGIAGDLVAALLEKGYVATSGELKGMRLDGTEFFVDSNSVLSKNENGEPVGMICSFSDVTERKRAEKALRQSEETHRALVAGLPDIVMRFDREGRHLYVSKNAEDVMTIGAEDFIGKTHRELGFPEADCQLWEDGIHQVFDSGTAFETEFSFDGKKGTTVFNWRLHPEFDTQGVVQTVLSLSRDITARLQMEREKAELAGKMVQQQRLEAIGTLASGVAHEINNPINGVINYAQLIADESGDGTTVGGYAREIITETDRVASIVRNLLAFSHQDSRSHSPALISDIVEATLSLISTIIRHDQILLTVDVPSSLPKLKCRSQQIQQVLMNLVTNARDALNDRFPGYDDEKTLSITAAELKREGRRWIRVTVKDNGAGISPEIQERIFEPFFTTKGREKGTGLGLSISHGIVGDHHGLITVDSASGQGTRIVVELPVDNGWTLDSKSL